MSKISTLVDDIYEVLMSHTNKLEDVTSEQMADYGMNVVKHISGTVEGREQSDVPRVEEKKIYATELGESCLRKLWFKYNGYAGVPLTPATINKFLYGNILEENLLFLAKVAGHSVTEEQAPVKTKVKGTEWIISGRIDAIIDGHIVDVKSCSSFAFQKYGTILRHEDDAFGYNWQLSYYCHQMPGDSIYEVPYFLMQDKQNGGLKLVESTQVTNSNVLNKAQEITVNTTLLVPPNVPNHLEDVPFQKSGNMQLPMKCGYCEFKHHCRPKVRTFISLRGPVYLTEVKREPKMPEVTDNA